MARCLSRVFIFILLLSLSKPFIQTQVNRKRRKREKEKKKQEREIEERKYPWSNFKANCVLTVERFCQGIFGWVFPPRKTPQFCRVSKNTGGEINIQERKGKKKDKRDNGNISSSMIGTPFCIDIYIVIGEIFCYTHTYIYIFKPLYLTVISWDIGGKYFV